jgi:transposase
VLLRLAYLGVTNALAMLRLLPMSDRAKDAEILALRHQITVLERQLQGEKARFAPADRAFLAAVLHRHPRDGLRRIRLLVRPETVRRWHRDLIARRHARISRPKRAGRPPTVRSIRVLVLRLARENSSWGYRRIHGELLVLGVKVAPSTVWEILKDAGIDPAPERTSDNWRAFLRSQAEAILAADFFETVTLTGTRMYILAVIEHASRRIRILGATASPSVGWVTQAVRNLAMDLEDAGCRARFLIRVRCGRTVGRRRAGAGAGPCALVVPCDSTIPQDVEPARRRAPHRGAGSLARCADRPGNSRPLTGPCRGRSERARRGQRRRRCVHPLSAMLYAARPTPAQREVDHKISEIAQVAPMLEHLELPGTVVLTADALLLTHRKPV